MAFQELKQVLVNPTLLSFPDYVSGASPMELHVDASDIGAGACLSQIQGGVNCPIAYISKTFSGTQRNYSTIDKELTALRWAVKSLTNFSQRSALCYLHRPYVTHLSPEYESRRWQIGSYIGGTP